MISNTQYGEFKDTDFKRLSSFIYKQYGINLYPKKKVLVKSRLQRRLKALGINSYSEYCDFVINSEKGSEESLFMVDRISTNKTDFFREPEHFDILTKKIIPQYLKESKKNKLEIWSAGCSTGQEPYTLAMVLSDLSKTSDFKFQIFASDISYSVLKTANRAIYNYELLGQIPIEFRTKYLLRAKDKSNPKIRMAPNIREKVQFFQHNLLFEERTTIAKKLDIIFCRNTLIYFDRPTQERVLNNLLSKLDKGGYLFLGHSESLINLNISLKHVFPSVYKKEKN
jgi:chemotaxis protein methyltransferase CheR